MKYINLSGLPLTWTKVGSTSSLTSTYGGGFANPPLAVFVNGYFGMLYALFSGSTSYGAILFLFDGKGNMCTYRSSNFVNNGPFTTCAAQNFIWQSQNVFVWSTQAGGFWRMVIPNVFTPGQTYVLPISGLVTPNPCNPADISPSKVIYCSQQNKICYEFIQAFAGANNYWASIADSTNNFLAGGFIGNYPTTYDPFDRIAYALPPFVQQSDQCMRNGYNFFGNFGNESAPYQVIGFNQPFLMGDASQLVCGGSGNSNVFCTAINSSQVYPYRDYNCPVFIADSGQTAQGITDWPGYFVFPDSGVNYVFSEQWMIALSYKAGNNAANACAYSINQKLLYSHVQTSAQVHYTGDVYVASLDLSPYAPPANIVRSVHNGLANYHRAVSTRGTFQA